jgi:hypothetical protein
LLALGYAATATGALVSLRKVLRGSSRLDEISKIPATLAASTLLADTLVARLIGPTLFAINANKWWTASDVAQHHIPSVVVIAYLLCTTDTYDATRRRASRLFLLAMCVVLTNDMISLLARPATPAATKAVLLRCRRVCHVLSFACLVPTMTGSGLVVMVRDAMDTSLSRTRRLASLLIVVAMVGLVGWQWPGWTLAVVRPFVGKHGRSVLWALRAYYVVVTGAVYAACARG